MGFVFSVGNQGASGSQLQKRLLKHFNLPARDVATAGRQFPISSRIDLQSGLENLLNGDASTTLLGLVSPNSHESLTFAQMLGGPHAYVNVGPLQYDDVDIGDSVPTRALKNGLWMGRHNGQPFAILLAPGERFGFQTGVGVEVAVPVGDAGAQFSQNFFRQLEQQIVQGRTYRGRVISLEAHHHPMGGGSSVKVHRLAKVAREQVILPEATLATLDRNVAGFIAVRGELKSMHFQARKGLLFYGPPGTGKSEPADFPDRDGGMRRGPLPGSRVASTGPRCEADPCSVCEAIREVEQERLLDAEAIAEAVDRQNMRFVPIKTDDQLDLQALHRVRDRLIARRTSVINQLRAFLLERGLVFATSPAKLRERMPEILENAEEDLTPRMRNLLAMLWSEWKELEFQIEEMNDEVERIASSDAGCMRLRQIPGIGPLVATAIVAAIGNGAAFHKGREFAAWLGIVPRQYSTGGKAKLYGISKRGNNYLRKILIHGARAVVLRSKRDRIAIGEWMTALEARAPRNVLIVATANKLARVAWTVLSSGQDYQAAQNPVLA